MSFLLIVPEGWLEADTAPILAMTDENTLSYAAENEPGTIDAFLGDTGQLPEGTTVAESRVFKDGANLRLWFRAVEV